MNLIKSLRKQRTRYSIGIYGKDDGKLFDSVDNLELFQALLLLQDFLVIDSKAEVYSVSYKINVQN